jgi:hypothetical protein
MLAQSLLAVAVCVNFGGQQKGGKRGGSRVIYYWAVSQEQLLMLLIYSKSEREDLTREQLKTLKKMVEEEYP